MKGDFKFTLTNDNIKKAIDEKDDGIRKALIAIGMNAEGYAKRSLTDQGAVDTGRLRNSVTHEEDATSVQVGTNVEYAPYIELGTYKMRARPYIKPAIADHIPEYKEILKKFLEGNSID